MASTTNQPPATQAIAKRDPQRENVLAIRNVISTDRYKAQLNAALKHAGIPVDRMISIAMSVINGSDKLRLAEPMSMAGAILRCAQMGLVPDGNLGHAYLVPFKNGGLTAKAGHDVYEVQAMVGYRGYVHKAYQAKDIVQSFFARNVYENDIFELDLGNGQPPKHTFDIKKPRGVYIASYAVLKLKNGETLVEVMMKEDVDKVRARSKSSGNGPWVSDYEEMARKTPLRRLAKWCPDPELQRLAVEDENSEFGTDTIIVDKDTGEIQFVSVEESERTEAKEKSAENGSRNANSELRDRLDKSKAQNQESAAAPAAEAKGNTPEQSTTEKLNPDPQFAIDNESRAEWVKGTVTAVFKPEKKGKATSLKMDIKMGEIRLSTFHGGLFEALGGSKGKVLTGMIARKGEFINLETIKYIDDVEYHEGKPLPADYMDGMAEPQKKEDAPQGNTPAETAPDQQQKSDMAGDFFDKK